MPRISTKPSGYGSNSHDKNVTACDTRFIFTPYNPCMSKQVPTHYRKQPIQPIEIIDAYGLDFKRGNALKYLLRAGSKLGEEKSDDRSAGEGDDADGRGGAVGGRRRPGPRPREGPLRRQRRPLRAVCRPGRRRGPGRLRHPAPVQDHPGLQGRGVPAGQRAARAVTGVPLLRRRGRRGGRRRARPG